MLRIAINGYGRIGRCLVRALFERDLQRKIHLCAINDLGDPATLAHLTRFDSTFGRFAGQVDLQGDLLQIDDQPIHLLREREVINLPWQQHGIDLVLECTGKLKKRVQVEQHLTAGSPRVLLSHPLDSADLTVVYGVNHELLGSQQIVSNASCTTNCLAPVVKVLHESFGVERGLMTTTHAYTNDQRILDLMHTDLRRARAAALNIVPTSTGAAKAIGLVMPELRGKLHGMALRVPVPTVSVVDLVADLKHAATAETINEALKKAAEGHLKGILAYCDKPLVSSDFRGHPASAIIDAISTVVLEGKMAKVIAWYDNE